MPTCTPGRPKGSARSVNQPGKDVPEFSAEVVSTVVASKATATVSTQESGRIVGPQESTSRTACRCSGQVWTAT